jgi:beclin
VGRLLTARTSSSKRKAETAAADETASSFLLADNYYNPKIMYCQKCRSPLKLDGSLESLNPAAFDLLIGRQLATKLVYLFNSLTNSPTGSTSKSLPEHPNTISSHRVAYSQDRRDLYDRASRQSTSPVYRRTIPPPRHGAGSATSYPRLGRGDSGGMSFVMLTESQVSPPQIIGGEAQLSIGRPIISSDAGRDGEEKSFSSQAERATRLFEIISARSDIDHPICTECTDMLLEGLQKRLSTATKEQDAYISFLKTLNSSVPSAEDIEAADQSLKTTLGAETAAYEELLILEKEKAAVDEELAALEEESRQLDLEEEKFWRDRNAFALTLAEFHNERDALNMRYDHDSRQLERLQRTNVYNDAFCIGHDGYFGTINGLRLGRLANPSVDWAEINAAWGQTLLLLATIAERLGFHFQGYRLKPMGSTSKIEKIEYPQQLSSQTSLGTRHPQSNSQPTSTSPKITSLDLFSSGDLPLNLPWLHRRFDNGMVAFLECLRQLGEYVEKTPPPVSARRGGPVSNTSLELPYKIKRDKIGDASIKLGFNQNDETWTRACKYTLTCCKYLLAHASNVASQSSGSLAAVAAVPASSTDRAPGKR